MTRKQALTTLGTSRGVRPKPNLRIWGGDINWAKFHKDRPEFEEHYTSRWSYRSMTLLLSFYSALN